MTKVAPLWEMTKELSLVAMGTQKADLVLKGGKLVNVNTHEIIPNTDVAIKSGRIALVGDANHTIGENTIVIDAKDYYIAPGFMDGHLHVESSMLTVSQYSNAVVPRGTTAIFMDPHEIANVLGMPGVKLMTEEGKKVSLRVFNAMPSCVPATDDFEDTGAKITVEDIKEALSWDETAGLGEMMNFVGVVNGDDSVHAKISETLKAHKCVTGHFSISDDTMLNAYVAAGCRSCHESVTAEDALSKMRLGMYAKIREGSAWHDLKEVVKAITERQVSSRFAILVSDDSHPETLIGLGHLDHIVRRAIEEGVNPITAIQMVTINVAECFHMAMDFGSVSPGKIADIVLLSDLTKVKVDKVILGGKVVAENGRMITPDPIVSYPDWSKDTVKLKEPLTIEDFVIKAEGDKKKVRIMEVEEAKVGTKVIVEELPVIDGALVIPPETNIAKAAVFERHHKTGTRTIGLVKGFGLQKGAVASTVAHDSHNLLILGTNDFDMQLAGNYLAKQGGGMIAVKDGEIIANLPLPIAGLITDRPVEEVQAQVRKLEEAWKTLGCNLVSPFMTMSLLSLAVLPEMRITNRGLVDTLNFKYVGLFVD